MRSPSSLKIQFERPCMRLMQIRGFGIDKYKLRILY